MTISTFNVKLEELIGEAVEYFHTHYVNRYRKHMENVQSQNEEEESIGNIHVYSHIDTDGLCAASILSIALKREGFPYHITILKQLQEQYIRDIRSKIKENQEFVFFLDFGSGQLNEISEYLLDCHYIILDHHQPLSSMESIAISGIHVNPYFADINGSNEISGAGMSYLFAKKLHKDNIDLSAYAIVGAIGDCQNAGEQQTFFGENTLILQDALDSSKIIQDVEPLLPRTVSLPFGLANSLPEGINLFQNDTQKATYFLNKIGIKYEDGFGHPRFLPDLSTAEKTKLTSALVQKFVSENTDNTKSIGNLLTTHYLLPQFKEYPEIYDAQDLSTMLNACGRLNQPSIGIACCMSQSNDNILKSIENSSLYRQKLQECIQWLVNGNKITYYKGILAFDGEDMISDLLVGVICSMLLDSPIIEKDKAIIGYAYSDKEKYKISARCSKELILKGVDLSQAIRTTCTELRIKSQGGGHPPAAGAFIPTSQIREFLSTLDEEIRSQMKEPIVSKSHSKKTTKKTKFSSNKDIPSTSTGTKQKKGEKLLPEEKKSAPNKKSKGLDHFLG